VVALRWIESAGVSERTDQQLAMWQREGVHADILEILSTHLETGRLAAWGSEENLVDETWVVILHPSCAFTVDAVITQIETELAATNTSVLVSGNRQSRQNPTGHPAENGLVRKFTETRMPGFTFVCSAEALPVVLENDCVHYVQQDFSATVDDIPERSEDGLAWGLDLIDGSRDGEYTYVNTGMDSGTAVRIFVLDTPILSAHPEFGDASRVLAGADFTGSVSLDEREACSVPGEQDCLLGLLDPGSACSGHGTHVAGVVAGATVGVAKGAVVVAVAVMDCAGRGSAATVMAGIDFVIAMKSDATHIPTVMSVSLGGPRPVAAFKDPTLDPNYVLAKAASDLGVVMVVAAGNSDNDARYLSPAFLPNVVTVCSIDDTLERSVSNYGKDVDICAPGVRIRSADASVVDDAFGYATMSGTSCAVAHVAGSLALFLQSNEWSADEQVGELLTHCVVEGYVNMLLQTAVVPNRLLRLNGDCAAMVIGMDTPPPPRPLPLVEQSRKWTLHEGTCHLDAACITSTNYPLPYPPYEFCKFTSKGGPVKVEAFDVESGYDVLTVHGYDGQLGPGVVFDGLPGQRLEWYSDSEQAGVGWKLCDGESFQLTPPVPPTPTPPVETRAPALLPEWKVLGNAKPTPKPKVPTPTPSPTWWRRRRRRS